MDKFLHIAKNESASTLTESLVALALLMVVIVPTIGFLGIISTDHPAKRQSIAFHHAQHAMEKTLAQESYSDSLFSPAPGWTIHRQIEKNDRLVHVTISAFRGEQDHPVLEIYTARLHQSLTP